MSHELIPAASDRPIRITAVSRLKHADLYAAAKQLGGITALARFLDVEPGTVCNWVNMTSVPKFQPRKTGRWTEKFIKELEIKLYEITGKTVDDLWPPNLRNAKAFLASKKIYEQTREIAPRMLTLCAKEAQQDRQLAYTATQFDTAAATELRETAEAAIRTLPEREAKIVRLILGFEDGRGRTLAEAGEVFNIGPERTRQIYSKAIRKLQQPGRGFMQSLVEFVPDMVVGHAQPPTERWPSEIYKKEEETDE